MDLPQEEIRGKLLYVPGDVVEVFGLESEVGSRLNGLRATVNGWIEEKERYEVEFGLDDAPVKYINLKPGNIRSARKNDASSDDVVEAAASGPGVSSAPPEVAPAPEPSEAAAFNPSAVSSSAEASASGISSPSDRTGPSSRKPLSLRAAVKACDAKAVEAALAKLGPGNVEAALDATDGSGRCLLHVCCGAAVRPGAGSVVRLLVEQKARLDVQDKEGKLPLSLAVASALEEQAAENQYALDTILSLLLAGAAAAAVEEWREADGALARAAGSPGGAAVIRVLQEFGATLPWYDTESGAASRATEAEPSSAQRETEPSVTQPSEPAAPGRNDPLDDNSLQGRCEEQGIPLEVLGPAAAEVLLGDLERWKSLGVKNLRLECKSKGLPTDGCVEKSEIVNCLREAAIREARKAPRSPAEAAATGGEPTSVPAVATPAPAEERNEDIRKGAATETEKAPDLSPEEQEKLESQAIAEAMKVLPEEDEAISQVMMEAVDQLDAAVVAAGLERLRSCEDGESLVEDCILAFDVDGNTMLHRVAMGSLPTDSPASAFRNPGERIAEMLLACEADVSQENLLGETPLISAARATPTPLGVIRALLAYGADPCSVDTLTEETALMEAASKGDRLLCSMLLDAKADAGQKNQQDQSAVDLAYENGHLRLIPLLTGEPEPEGEEAEDLEWQSRAPKGCATLREAVKSNDVEAVQQELELLDGSLEAALEAVDLRGWTLLHLCADRAACDGAADVARLLLERSARTDSCDARGRPPLALAVERGLVETEDEWASTDFIRVLLVASRPEEWESCPIFDEWRSGGGALANASASPTGEAICKLLQNFGMKIPWFNQSSSRSGEFNGSPAAAEETSPSNLQERCAELGVPLEDLGTAEAQAVLHEVERWRGMSIKQLQKECKLQGLPTEGCVEKSEITARLQQVRIWHGLPVASLKKECEKVRANATGASKADLEDALLSVKYGGASRSVRLKEQCEARGIPLGKLENGEESAAQLLQKVQTLETSSVGELKQEFKKYSLAIEAGMEKQDMVNRLKEVEVWQELTMAELQSLCNQRGLSTVGMRDQLWRRLAGIDENAAGASAQGGKDSRFKNFFSYGNDPSKEKEAKKEEPKGAQKPPTGSNPFKQQKSAEEMEYEKMWEARADENRRQFQTGNRNHAGMPGGQRRPGPGEMPKNQFVSEAERRRRQQQQEQWRNQQRQQTQQQSQQGKIEQQFKVLGLPVSADMNEVKKKYRKLALQYHPDKNPGKMKEQAEAKFREVQEAYDKICEYLRNKG